MPCRWRQKIYEFLRVMNFISKITQDSRLASVLLLPDHGTMKSKYLSQSQKLQGYKCALLGFVQKY